VATYVGIIGHGQLLFQGTPAELHGRTRERLIVAVDRAKPPESCREPGEAL
jgi:ABC-type multidrug transport system ATPase subunit